MQARPRATEARTQVASPGTISCPRCNGPNDEWNSLCQHCGGPLTSRLPDVADAIEGQVGRPSGTMEAPSSNTASYIPGTHIALGDGETLWREYPVTQLGGGKRGLGTLYVTDSRLILFARTRPRGSRSSALIEETKLEHVSGLSAYVSRGGNLFSVASWGLLSFLFSIAFLNADLSTSVADVLRLVVTIQVPTLPS